MVPQGQHAGSDSQELDLGILIKPLRRHWLRLLVIWMLASAMVAAVVAHLSPSFTSRAMLYLEAPQTNIKAGVPDLLSPLMGGDADLESQKEILGGSTLAVDVIEQMGLNAQLDGPDEYLPIRPWFWQWYLDKNPARFAKGLHIRQVRTAPGVFVRQDYLLRFQNERQFVVLDAATGQQVGQSAVNLEVEVPRAAFVLSYVGDVELYSGLEFELTIRPAQAMLRNFGSARSVSGGGRGTLKNNLITVSYTAGSPFLAQQVVQAMVDHFLALNREWNTASSRAILEFVEDQVDELQADMQQAYRRLATFQAQSGLVSLEPQIQEDVAAMVRAEVELRQQRLRLHELERLIESVEAGRSDLHLSTFVEDQLVRETASRLADLDSRITAMRIDFQEGYPPLQRLLVVRESLMDDLRVTLTNYAGKTREFVQELEVQVAAEKSRFHELPEKSRDLADYTRSAKVFEELYLLLLREKQRARVAEASTLSSLRVVDAPFVPLEQSAPRPKQLLAAGSAASLMLAVLCVVVPAMRIRWFTDVEEIREQFRQPIYAMVPRRAKSLKRGSIETLELQAQTPFAEAIRLLRANLLHTMAGRSQQVVMIASAMPGDGKTSIAVNLAGSLARAERVDRVLLIDADMPRATVHSVMNLPLTPGLSDYLNGDVEIDQIIHTVALPDGSHIDVITAGQTPPAPGDLVESALMRELLEHVRGRYTFTIVDSPPYPLVAMASTLAGHVDRILSVCSVNCTERSVFQRHVDDLSSICKHHGLVVNMLANGNGQYGYGYAYGYGPQANQGKRVERSAAAL